MPMRDYNEFSHIMEEYEGMQMVSELLPSDKQFIIYPAFNSAYLTESTERINNFKLFNQITCLPRSEVNKKTFQTISASN